MLLKRHLLVTASILFIVIVTLAAMEPPLINDFKNLKVLPKDISPTALDKIMQEQFNKGLGVNCDYCHAKQKDGDDLDFPADTKPEKEIARNMMRMTMDINQKYFGAEHSMIGDSLLTVTCITCHRGEPYPVIKKVEKPKPLFGF